ncbi:methionyl-tRNA formyltransferase, mitochondrial isoform X2 [Dermatophagoides pteronyssinus]|uniref:methionyl-tRNA formyltransferase n=1 Tax=Dermatophagoides pteronyssinus TaxID=6956 RepID=A0A6P6Y541_DERPT|nr:methionyl-tRNA formyltransferase, mitochondrial-like isoform X2 [Dermatophagoides pteronyssinus]
MRSTLLLLSLVKRKWLSPANMVVSKSFLSSYAKQKSARELSILFYGSDDFSIASLKLLHKKLLNPGLDATVIVKNIQVVTTKCNNPVSLYCKKTDLPITLFDEYTVPNDQFDLGVVSSFGRLIPSQAINACHFGVFNIHGSLLPRWRGASPIQHAILHGDEITGVTIMKIHPNRFDVGEILAQKPIEIVHRISAKQLKQVMAPIGAQLLWDCIEDLDNCLANARKQPEEGVTYARKLKITDGEIDWTNMNAYEIDRRFRAFNGTIDVYTYWIDGTPLRLGDILDPDLVNRLNISVLAGHGHYEHLPGLVYYHKKRHILCIASANETWSAFRSLTLKGRRKMSALGFSNTFIRPIVKEFKANNQGQRPFLIVGQTEKHGGMFNMNEFEQIKQQYL